MEIKNGLIQDVSRLLALDYKIFPKEWHLSEHFVKQILTKNPETYRVLYDLDKIKGYYCLYPLSKKPYEMLLAGNLRETALLDYVTDYFHPKEVYLYFFTLIVDIHDPLHKQYTKNLIQDIGKTLGCLEEKGIRISEIGAISITQEGDRILQRMGLCFTEDISEILGTRALVYRCKLSELKISLD